MATEGTRVTTAKGFEHIAAREQGLHRRLTAGQMSMIAIGGAIGTGLFLGSKFAIGIAGPSVILSYAISGFITLLLMGCLAEMTIAHPTSGSFGAYAEHYISPLAGYLVRWAYWVCIVMGVGTEVTAIADYMRFWFPSVPAWIWILLFPTALIGVNARSVRTFGAVEYWFSSIKIAAIVGFILLGAYVVWGTGNPEFGIRHLREHGGFFPNGVWGMWVAVVISIFSYLSIEMIAVAAGEAERPAQAVRKAFRATLLRLVIFYLLSLLVILVIVPWNRIGEGHSPFVTVMEALRIPYAAGILNFVVIVAALSAMNSMLYITTRMMFSLSRGGDAPARLGTVNRNGVPINALMLSTTGIALAAVVYVLFPEKAFTLMVSLSMFGAMFTWMMIFATHYAFRRHHDSQGGLDLPFTMVGFPLTTLLGGILMLAVLVTTAFTDVFRMTLVFGIPFLGLLTVSFYVIRRPGSPRALQETDPCVTPPSS
jgi:L-asparagine transporter-like permease